MAHVGRVTVAVVQKVFLPLLVPLLVLLFVIIDQRSLRRRNTTAIAAAYAVTLQFEFRTPKMFFRFDV